MDIGVRELVRMVDELLRGQQRQPVVRLVVAQPRAARKPVCGLLCAAHIPASNLDGLTNNRPERGATRSIARTP